MEILAKFTLSFIVSIALLAFPFKPARAIVDPLKRTNNIYGIHIIDESNLEKAFELVNSNGGDWGYVTIVIRKDERINERWQRVFNKMRRLHLIPIVRIATIQSEGIWVKPDINDIGNWVDFLNSLNWVVENRYIVIGNEPNHRSEWGGESNPEEYSNYLKDFSTRLKKSSNDYFVLPAALDASAPSDNDHTDAASYLKSMVEKNEDIFEFIDGWNSHSYPNPGFSGSWEDTGRGSIKTYAWELNYLKTLGLEKELPVFITETGWVHSAGGQYPRLNSENTLSSNYVNAYKQVWEDDERIVAVTPFILSYYSPPFDKFSWTKQEGGGYLFFENVASLNKVNGRPSQIISGNLKLVVIPQIIKVEDTKVGIALAENTGQAIWHKDQTIYIQDGKDTVEITTPIFADIEPGHMGLVYFKKIDSSVLAKYAYLY